MYKTGRLIVFMEAFAISVRLYKTLSHMHASKVTEDRALSCAYIDRCAVKD